MDLMNRLFKHRLHDQSSGRLGVGQPALHGHVGLLHHGVLNRQSQHGGRYIAAMHIVDSGHVETAKEILTVHACSQRDVDVMVIHNFHPHAGAEHQMLVVGAQNNLCPNPKMSSQLGAHLPWVRKI